jgi:Domain of unknown function (DUF4203)
LLFAHTFSSRTSFFLIGFYTLSLVCISLILKFGVLPAINPPSQTIRGMFVLASTIAGFAGGAIAIFFWKGARYFIGAWGGFALALWIQCFSDGGLIKPIGFRWILYIGQSSAPAVQEFSHLPLCRLWRCWICVMHDSKGGYWLVLFKKHR